MLKIIQSRSWTGFQRSLARIPAHGWLVATPPDLTIATLQPRLLRDNPNYCIQINIHDVLETYMIAYHYGRRLLCGSHLLHLDSKFIEKTELMEEDGSPTTYLR